MKEKTSALLSSYIIDGTFKAPSPAMMLARCLSPELRQSTEIIDDNSEFSPVADETVDSPIGSKSFTSNDIFPCLEEVRRLYRKDRLFPTAFPEQFTRLTIAKAIIDSIWKTGHFKMGDLAIRCGWQWDETPIGNMTALYNSASTVSEYVDDLCLCLESYSYESSKRNCFFRADALIGPKESDEIENELFADSPFKSENPIMSSSRKCPSKLVRDDGTSWLIYIPFASAEYRLGGSLIEQAKGPTGDTAPDISFGDYLMDCFEVVRELVEDGVVIAGSTVGYGGLLTAMSQMCEDAADISANLGDVTKSIGTKDIFSVLFSEVPGVLIQIKDIDYDYIDAELLLQEVAYFPLGHPRKGKGRISLADIEEGGISSILQSLLNGQSSEGED